jgi:hypothetical protein
LSTETNSRPSAGSCLQAWSAFDASGDSGDPDGSVAQAAEEARANGQIVLWDQSVRDYAIALYEIEAQRLLPLADAEVGVLLNRDALIRREWVKLNKMTGNRGSLVVLDVERARLVLAASADEDEIEGLA